jgi:hypothetical protein
MVICVFTDIPVVALLFGDGDDLADLEVQVILVG